MKRLSLGALIVLGSLIATRVIAEIITASPISGNFALTSSGYEIVTDGTNTFHFDIVGEGLVTADGNGNLSGNANFTASNPSSTLVPGSPVSAPCGGTLAGTATEAGNGTAEIQLQFTSSTPAPANPLPFPVGPQEACIPMAIALNCVEIYPESGYASPLPASGGTSASPDPTPTPTPLLKKRRPRKANGSLIPVDPWPPFYLSSATRLKCIATGITSSSTVSSVEGESLTVDLQQTAPASVVVPPPVIGPSPVPGPSPLPLSYPTPTIPNGTPGTNG